MESSNGNKILNLISEMKENLAKTYKYPTPEAEIKIKEVKKKNLFNYEGFNLDLTYISERIIAMGLPRKENYPEYNNLFVSRHGNNVKVYNLCSEFEYEDDIFNQQIRFPFNDRETPKFETIITFCLDVENWLSLNDNNVVAIHCKAGIGRTGTMICSYLLYTKFIDSPDDVITFFAHMRTKDGNALKNPSQKRYVNYFYNHLVNNSFKLYPVLDNIPEYNFTKFTAKGFANPLTNLNLYIQNGTLNSFKIKMNINSENNKENKHECEINSKFVDDIKFALAQEDSDNPLCYIFINTIFLNKPENDNPVIIKLTKQEVDGAFRDINNEYFSDEFEVEIYYQNK